MARITDGKVRSNGSGVSHATTKPRLATHHETITIETPDETPNENLERLEIVGRATNDAVRDWDIATGRLWWNAALHTALGYDADAASREIAFWQTRLHPQDREPVAAALGAALCGDAKFWTNEYRFRRPDGSYAQILERAAIIRNAAGDATRLVGAMMDITERKHLQEQVIRSQKMEAFGQLAGGVAHDFNNFLTTILGYSDLLLEERGVKGHIADHVAEIKSAAARASALTRQLLAFSRKQPLEAKIVEVNSVITNMERSLFRLLGENIQVTCHLHHDKSGVYIQADPGQLTQLLLNLAVNSRDAMRGGGELTFETSSVTIAAGAPPPCGFEELPAGEYVTIVMSDNGTGMSDEVKAHIFEPFFTTKEEAQGSGLGLATSYGIIRQSGGQICVDSELGHGTKVTIYLPKVSAPPVPSYRKPRGHTLPTGTETVLVLEDEVSVRHISVRVLRTLGYDVIEASNGDDAQRLIQEANGRKIDLLLTDLVMPQMSGKTFADWLRKTSPTTKIIVVSGYLEESLHPSDRRDDEMSFLAKPFDPEQLAAKVRAVLDGNSLRA